MVRRSTEQRCCTWRLSTEDLDVAQWLIEHGADVNARAAVDRSGFGGHTPIFNCVVTFNAGRRDEVLGRLLLDCGANPNARASIRKRLAFARDSSVHEYQKCHSARLGPRVPRTELRIVSGDEFDFRARRNGMTAVASRTGGRRQTLAHGESERQHGSSGGRFRLLEPSPPEHHVGADRTPPG